ncbi:MAG: hypothetical protein LAT57_02015 [Balneolales bacterium]|nr:hypothetical protein [Balneolales bacterium]
MKNLMFLMVGMLFITACDSTNLDEMTLQQVALEIQDEIRTPRASNISQCKLLPVGPKPCGGPIIHLSYSTMVSNEGRLNILNEKYWELRQLRNIEYGLSSDCSILNPPKITFENGVCGPETNWYSFVGMSGNDAIRLYQY